MPAITYLHIRGTLLEAMLYQPRPGYESSRPGRRAEGDPAYQLVLLDREERPLLSTAPQVTPRGCGTVDDPLRWRVSAILPLHPQGAAYELRRGEVRLYRAAIPHEPPRAPAVSYQAQGSQISLRWQPAQPGEGGSAAESGITYSVAVELESGRRITLARRLVEPAWSVDLNTLPASGKGRLLLVTHDGVRSSEVEVAAIDLPERPPAVHILAPAADARLPFGQVVSILGACFDPAGQPCSPEHAVWSLDGQPFASGTLVTALDHLPPGDHRLSLAYPFGEGRPVEASLALTVEPPDEDYRQWLALVAES